MLAAGLAPGLMLYPVWHLGGLGPSEDDILYYLPSRTFFHDAVRSSELPTLNPWTGLGRPFLADPQSAAWYPGTWLFALLEPELAYPASLWLHFSLALIGGYRLLRWQRLSRPAATLGGLAFAFGGFMVAHRVHFALQHSAAWTPWVFWRIGRLAEMAAWVGDQRSEARITAGAQSQGSGFRSLRRLADAALLAGLQILAGHFQVAALTALGGLVWLIASRHAHPRVLAGFMLTWLLAAGLAAVQLVPTALYLRETTRIEQGFWDFTQNSWHPAALINFVLPMFLGQRTPNLFDQPYWGPSHQVEQFGYVGLLPLILIASVGLPAAWRCPRARGWLILLGFALLLAAGKYGPLCPLLYLVPGSQVFRVPARALLLVNLALAGSAALAFDRLMRRGQSPLASKRAAESTLFDTTRDSSIPGEPPRTESARDGEREMLLPPLATSSQAVLLPPPVDDGVTTPWRALLPLTLLGLAGLIVAGGVATLGPEPLRSAAVASLRPTNPAILVPVMLGLLSTTVLAILYRRPGSQVRQALVCGVLSLDLGLIGYTLDVPRAVASRSELLPHGQRTGWQEEIRASGLRLWVVTPRTDAGPGEYVEPISKLVANVNLLLRLPVLTDYGPLQPRSYARYFDVEPWGEARAPLELLADEQRLADAAVGWILLCDPRLPAPVGGHLTFTTPQGWRLYQRPGRLAWWRPLERPGESSAAAVTIPCTSPTLDTRCLDVSHLPHGVAGELTVSLLNLPGWRIEGYDARLSPSSLLLTFPFRPDGRTTLVLRYHTPGLSLGSQLSLLGLLLLAGLRSGIPLPRFRLRRV